MSQDFFQEGNAQSDAGHNAEGNTESNAESDTNASSIDSLLSALFGGTTQKPTATTPLQEARYALRRDNVRELDIIYNNAVKVMGDDRQFVSTRHLAATLYGLMIDGVYTLWDPFKNFLESPFIKGKMKDETGEEKTVIDFIKEQKMARGSDSEESSQSLDKGLASLVSLDKMANALADYCATNKKSPDKVLRSKKQMLGLIIKVYDGLDNYEKKQQEALQNVASYVDKLDKLQHMPFEVMIPILIKTKVSSDVDISELGINTADIGVIVRDYVTDFAKFGKVFLNEIAKYQTKEIEQYKKLAQDKKH
jgi:hypothetical protein